MKKTFFITAAVLLLCFAFAQTAFAETQYAEKAVKAISGELGWVAIGGTMIGLAASVKKRAVSVAISSVLIGGIVSTLLFKPDLLKTIGETLSAFLN